MLTIPILRWGKPYESLEQESVVHFATGEPIARISQTNGGLIARDFRQAQRAQDVLRAMTSAELISRCQRAGELYLSAELPLGDGSQTPEAFVHAQSASTGLPEGMCRANMQKIAFVLEHMSEILAALTRGLDLEILRRGYGEESRGVTVSYQATTPILGAVLPSNSPGVHTLWLPAIPLQVGLALKPGSSEPWTPYRLFAAFTQAGIPAEAISLYPGSGADVGNALLNACPRSMIFGSQQTVERYADNPRVQPHGPGWSKILLGDDVVDDWERHLDMMVESIYANGGRSCVNASGIWASRHTEAIAAALAERLGPIEAKPPTDPEAGLAAFTTPGVAPAVWQMIEADLATGGVQDVTAKFGPRLVQQPRCDYLRPMIVHTDRPDHPIASKEFMFPFTSVVRCPQDQMISRIGSTLVATAITEQAAWREQLLRAANIDRLNLGPIPTCRLNWLQPHEGNIVEFLYRARAVQLAP